MSDARFEAQNVFNILRTHGCYTGPCTDTPPEGFTVQKMHGGITNTLVKASFGSDDTENKNILVRFFGEGTDDVIDRSMEARLLERFNEIKFGPTTYANFQGGRLEEFLPGSCPHPCDLNGNKVLQDLIAKEMAKMHYLDMGNSFNNEKKECSLFYTLNEWCNVAMNVKFNNNDDNDNEKKLNIYNSLNLSIINNEIEILKNKIINKHINYIPILSHNDLLSGNIIYCKEQNTVTFIDFEYGSYNYAEYDIANHFCEYAGFDCDYSNFPSEMDQKIFIKSYLSAVHDEFKDQPKEQQEQRVDKMYIDIQLFVLLSHLSWGVWAVVQARTSPDMFYIEYAKQRIDGYYAMKEQCLSIV